MIKKITKITLIPITAFAILSLVFLFFSYSNFFNDIMENAGQDSDRFDHEIISNYARGDNPNGVRAFTVNVPHGYADDPQKKYPVLFHAIEDNASLDITNKAVRALSANDEIVPMIIVSLHLTGWNPGKDIHSPIEDREYQGPKRFLNHIQKEVIPFLNANYRVSEERIITGWSRFGLIPDYALMIKPKLFTGYIKASVAGHGSVTEVLYDRIGIFIKQSPKLSARYYFAVGSEESQRHAEFNTLKKIIEANAPEGFVWESAILKNSDHGDTFEKGLTDGLKFYFSNQ